MKNSPLHRPSIHESGFKHTSGEAIYVDDILSPAGLLVGQVFASPHPRATIQKLSLDIAKQVPGVIAVLGADDIPGINDISPFSHDEPLLATDELYCVGQSVALVVAESPEACRAGIAAISLEVEAKPAIYGCRQAIDQESYIATPHVIARGDLDDGFASAETILEGEVESGGQDHFYLESQAALALPEEDGALTIWSSTQHPSEVQAKVGEVLGIPRQMVVVKTPRMGGGFGGKETQAAIFAALAALAVRHTGRPVKIWLNRDQDMTQTGKRHPFYSRYKAGFDKEGRITALKIDSYADAGWSADLSTAILDRCLFHLDNSYYIPILRFEGRVCKTNVVSNTAFRGFGGPQGVVVIESIINRAAEELEIDAAEVRRRNYYGEAPRNITPYGQVVEDCRLQRLTQELLEKAEYEARKTQIAAFNAQDGFMKRGLCFQPVKFGISFTNSVLNQAGALVLIYSDGSVQLNHGGTEMGQGLHTKMRAIAAHELGVAPEAVRVMCTATDKVPNTSATAASSGSDLNGAAVQQACEILRGRLRPIAAKELSCAPEDVAFSGGNVYQRGQEANKLSFAELAQAAYMAQVSLSATGYYRTPDIHYDREKGHGKPFHYYAFGGALTEVEVNGLTGEHKILRTDILHDVGNSLLPSIDRGQIEGAYIQGVGWLTNEELIWTKEGQLSTHSPDTYKIPALGDAPVLFNVQLLSRAHEDKVVHGSKAVGEPPFMLGISVLGALREAIAAFSGPEQKGVELSIPATPEAILKAIEKNR